MKTVMILLSFFIFSTAQSQQSILCRWGLKMLNSSAALTNYPEKYLSLPELGSVHLPPSTFNYSFRQDVALSFITLKGRRRFETTIGYQVSRLKVQKKTYGQGVNVYELYQQNSDIVARFAIGYGLLRKKALHMYLSAGPEIRFFHFKNDYSPINLLLNAVTSAESNVPFYNVNSYYLLKEYKKPNIGIYAAIDLELFRHILGFSATYNNKSISIPLENKKQNLYHSSTLFKIQYTYVLKYYYK